MRLIRVISGLLILLLGLTFALQNAKSVEFYYYVGNKSLPLSLLLVLTLACGLSLGILFGYFHVFKIRRRLYAMEKRALLAEKEVENLRSLPIRDSH